MCERNAYICSGNIATELKSKIMVNVTFKVERKTAKGSSLEFNCLFEREVALESLIGVDGVIRSLHLLYPSTDCRVLMIIDNLDNWK